MWQFFVPKFVDTEPGLLELFENVSGVSFFWDTVYIVTVAAAALFLPQYWSHLYWLFIKFYCFYCPQCILVTPVSKRYAYHIHTVDGC